MSGRSGTLFVPALLTFTGLAVLIGLGSWQIERKAWKEDLIAKLSVRLGAEPVPLPQPERWGALTQEADEFRRVRVQLDYGGPAVLLYTSGSGLRDDVKAPGYFVVVPGRVAPGAIVAVNRGYARERPSTAVAVPQGMQEIVGVLRWPEGPSWFVGDHDSSGDIWFRRDPQAMARLKSWGPVAPFYIEQEAPVPAGGVPHPARLKVNLPNNHLQYAVTWFALAVALVAVFIFWLRSRRRPAA